MGFIVAIVIALAIVAGWAALLALPVMLLWDWVMPAIFGLKVITFWQALGLNLLCGILFRSKMPKAERKED